MNDIQNNKLFWIFCIMLLFLLFSHVGKKALVDSVADRVIQKLQRDYSPSPYGPGIDPDKIDMQQIKKSSFEEKWGDGWDFERAK